MCLVLLVCFCVLAWKSEWLHFGAMFADEQTELFDQMRSYALNSTTPSEIAGFLQYIVHYYPSGTKQRAGSRLDRVVERHRAAVVRDIVGHLQRTTGDKLGENPDAWIEKYVRK